MIRARALAAVVSASALTAVVPGVTVAASHHSKMKKHHSKHSAKKGHKHRRTPSTLY